MIKIKELIKAACLIKIKGKFFHDLNDKDLKKIPIWQKIPYITRYEFKNKNSLYESTYILYKSTYGWIISLKKKQKNTLRRTYCFKDQKFVKYALIRYNKDFFEALDVVEKYLDKDKNIK